MKILNLYAGIGGNRKLWGDEHEITAVENKPEIAAIYKSFFPNDTVVVADAHDYLLKHHAEFDFIWSSPPCPSHSVTNNFLYAQGIQRYPDMALWQEIVLLRYRFKGKWVVENVKSYYEPFYSPIELDRHYIWSNFQILPFDTARTFNIVNGRATTRQGVVEELDNLQDFLGIKLPDKTKNARLLLRNCVPPAMGKHILDFVINPIETKQLF